NRAKITGCGVNVLSTRQVRLALGFLRETEPEMQDINAFQMRYNAFFQPDLSVGNRRGEASFL
ncbi:DUF1198 family protein, partial [Escherichia sp. TWPC-MK]